MARCVLVKGDILCFMSLHTYHVAVLASMCCVAVCDVRLSLSLVQLCLMHGVLAMVAANLFVGDVFGVAAHAVFHASSRARLG